MKAQTLEQQLLAIVKQIEEDLSSPCSPQEMQWFIDNSLAKLGCIEKQLIALIRKKESRLRRIMFDMVGMIGLGITVFYVFMR